MRSTLVQLAADVTVLAVDIQPVQPPGAERVLQVFGYAMWFLGFAFFLAFCVALGRTAWAHRNGEAGQGAMTIGLVLVLAAAFGVAGQLLTPLVG